jgi:hypothetical protein
MGMLVQKVLPDGESVLHANLQDDDAHALASRVIQAYRDIGAEVQVRLTPYVWDGENAEYALDYNGAVTLPRTVESDPGDEQPETSTTGGADVTIDSAPDGAEVTPVPKKK